MLRTRKKGVTLSFFWVGSYLYFTDEKHRVRRFPQKVYSQLMRTLRYTFFVCLKKKTPTQLHVQKRDLYGITNFSRWMKP
jgi:hypothetical protein